MGMVIGAHIYAEFHILGQKQSPVFFSLPRVFDGCAWARSKSTKLAPSLDGKSRDGLLPFSLQGGPSVHGLGNVDISSVSY